MSMAYPGLTHCSECGGNLNGGIGICESCQQVKKDDKQAITGDKDTVQQVTSKLKLIDILNKIANGELKEGTVVVWDDVEYPYKNKCLYGADGEKLFYWINTGNLNDEVELIEPQEPTDNTTEKIEELNPNNYLTFVDYDKDGNEEYKLDDNLAIMGDCSRGIKGIISKLNEVIRYINKEV